MTLVVDGMNVIGSVPDGWWRDRTGAMRRLLGRLQALEEGDVWLVLDGRERDLGDPGDVHVCWAPVADELIARLAADHPGCRVVTSDAELADRVRAAGGRVEAAGAFRRRLDGPAPGALT